MKTLEFIPGGSILWFVAGLVTVLAVIIVAFECQPPNKPRREERMNHELAGLEGRIPVGVVAESSEDLHERADMIAAMLTLQAQHADETEWDDPVEKK